MKGHILRKLREDKGLSREEFSNKIGVASSTISAYENGLREPSDEMKVKIANFFGVTVDYLLGLTQERHSNSVVTSEGIFIALDGDNKVTEEDIKTLKNIVKAFLDSKKWG